MIFRARIQRKQSTLKTIPDEDAPSSSTSGQTPGMKLSASDSTSSEESLLDISEPESGRHTVIGPAYLPNRTGPSSEEIPANPTQLVISSSSRRSSTATISSGNLSVSSKPQNAEADNGLHSKSPGKASSRRRATSEVPSSCKILRPQVSISIGLSGKV